MVLWALRQSAHTVRPSTDTSGKMVFNPCFAFRRRAADKRAVQLDPDVSAARMIDRCLALASSELGYAFSRNGADPRRRKRGAKGDV